ncbi:WD40 repeat-like protein [Aspergillus heteromorphus CBS 117.55]|uniref:WD40 repeat-like protein n=1 Tax=Aspergillus heteromorphus CBS 117.55 TaxID=1448321 RepID=A0A317WIA6_9EURO|nr:WD40 repeat-like protein [Aspergillus heteromorphus CBS 117.55]PWY85012.1 WD40 repeat-like protein [Aspergillus heteromorphus CBS 117.55]
MTQFFRQAGVTYTQSAKLVHRLNGNTGRINTMTLSTDGARLVSASLAVNHDAHYGLSTEEEYNVNPPDKTIRLWDTKAGLSIRILHGLASSVDSLPFTRDGKILAAAYENGIVQSWDTATGQALLPLEYEPSSSSTLDGETFHLDVAFSSDGKTISCTFPDGDLRLRDITSGGLLTVLDNRMILKSARFSPNGKLLATTSNGHMVQLWKPITGELLGVYKGLKGLSIGSSDDGHSLDTETGQLNLGVI